MVLEDIVQPWAAQSEEHGRAKQNGFLAHKVLRGWSGLFHVWHMGPIRRAVGRMPERVLVEDPVLLDEHVLRVSMESGLDRHDPIVRVGVLEEL